MGADQWGSAWRPPCESCNPSVTGDNQHAALSQMQPPDGPGQVRRDAGADVRRVRGYFVSPTALKRIIASREVQTPDPVRERFMALADASGTTKQVLCEECGTWMVKQAFRDWEDIIIDQCPKCGLIWLDPGELEKIQIYCEYLEDHPDPAHQSDQERKVILRLELQRQEAKRRAAAEDLGFWRLQHAGPGFLHLLQQSSEQHGQPAGEPAADARTPARHRLYFWLAQTYLAKTRKVVIGAALLLLGCAVLLAPDWSGDEGPLISPAWQDGVRKIGAALMIAGALAFAWRVVCTIDRTQQMVTIRWLFFPLYKREYPLSSFDAVTIRSEAQKTRRGPSLWRAQYIVSLEGRLQDIGLVTFRSYRRASQQAERVAACAGLPVRDWT